jgi:hypothetical protein
LNEVELVFVTAKFNGIIQKKAELERNMRIYEEIIFEIENLEELDEFFLDLLGSQGG